VTTATATTTSFEGEIVTFLRPQVLVALPLRPRSRPSARFQIGQDRLFPSVEAFPVHILAHIAVVIIAGNFDRVSKVIQVNHVCVCVVVVIIIIITVVVVARTVVICTQTLASWNTAARQVSVMIFDSFRIDT
jgi:hypothetical protein